jgi:3',5'-cyclic AMP phosphodiesterase CpdA
MRISASAMLKVVVVVVILLPIISCTSLKRQDLVRFVLIADPQMGFSDARAYRNTNNNTYSKYSKEDLDYFRLTIAKINKLSTPGEFVLILGDMVHKQSDEVSQWPDYHGALNALNLPYHEVMGNHDGWNANGLLRWRDTWGKQDIYSFTHRGVFFMGLNSYFFKKPNDDLEETTEQKKFIMNELKKNEDNPHKFIFQHFPLYLDSPEEAEDGNRNLPIAERNFMLEQIETYQIKAVFNGHTHYEIVRDYKGTLLLSANPSSKTLGKGSRGFYTIEYNKATQALSYRFIENTQAELDAFRLEP